MKSPFVHEERPDETTQFSMVQSSSIPRNQSCSMVILWLKSTLKYHHSWYPRCGQPTGPAPDPTSVARGVDDWPETSMDIGRQGRTGWDM